MKTRVAREVALGNLLLWAVVTACTNENSDGDTDSESASETGTDSESENVWRAPLGTTWQWQLVGTIDTSLDVEMYDVDLFDAPASTIAALRTEGHAVVCYFSAGSLEDWRPDAADFPTEDLGAPLDGWEGERWVDITSDAIRGVMRSRLDLAVEKGCDGVEPDNVDGYANENGLGLTADDQLDFNAFIAEEAHGRGLSVGLKNDLDQIEALEPLFDWALNEECLAFGECDVLVPFISAGKAVFHVEYVDEESDAAAKRDEICGEPSIAGFSTLVKTWDLTAFGLSCD